MVSPPTSSRLTRAVTDLRDDRSRFLVSLVNCRSLLGNEAEAQNLIADELQRFGLEVDAWEPNLDELQQHPAFCVYPGLEAMGYTNRPVVVGRLRGTGGGRSLILQGHIDVVSAEPESDWSHDPWGGTIIDGQLYGRGSSDMKGGLVSAISAVSAIVEAGIRLRGDVLVQSVIDEECYSNGALACAERGYHADAAIVAEPTDLRIVTAHAGVSHWRITVTGKSAHAAQKVHGVCAIDKAMVVYRALMELEADRGKRVVHPLFPNGSPVEIVVGTFHAGTWRSTVPAQAILEARVGFAPGETVDGIQAEIADKLAVACRDDEWLSAHAPHVERIGFTASAEIAETEPFVSTVQEVVRGYGLKHTTVEGMPAGCDMQSLVHHAGTPAIVWGPGIPEMAHTIDERIDLSEVDRATLLYAKTIAEWCGVGD